MLSRLQPVWGFQTCAHRAEKLRRLTLMFLALHAVVFHVPIDAGKLERISHPSLG